MDIQFWQNKSVLITGCTGLLGSWLTEALLEAGAHVVGLVRDGVAQSQLIRSGLIQQIDVVNGDIVDLQLMERVMAEYQVDTVFHLAAQTIVGIANRAPLATFETNIRGTWVVLEAARRSPTVRRMIVASSNHAYGEQPDLLPYREEVPLLGQHPYDVSKSCADLIARTYAQTYGLPVAVTRCANLYGGGDLNWNRIVPGTIRDVLQGRAPVIRSDGRSKRDYIFVQDVVRGYLLIAQHLGRADIQGEAFNFGAETAVSALDIVKTIIHLSDYPQLQPIIRNNAPNEIQDQYLSSDKVGRLLGWEPQYSLEAGLRETMGWYQDFLSGVAVS
ncbi:MAG: GDP-mannose 4,6-dehydratase [Chloroflexota bacterium]